MRFAERLGHLPENVPHARGRLCAVGGHHAFERRAVDELHGVVEDAIGRSTIVEDRDRVGVRQPCRQLHFTLEPQQLGVGRALGRQQLDGG